MPTSPCPPLGASAVCLAPSSTISSSSVSRPKRMLTCACASPACLSAFVSASWTIRYAESSIPAGSSRRSPSTVRSTGRPASHLADESHDLVEARLRRERVGGVLAQHPDEAAHLGERATADLLDRLEHLARRAVPAVEDAPLCAGLDDHHRDVGRDHVVELARDPRPLLDHGLARGELALQLGDLGAVLAVADPAADEEHDGERGHPEP